MSRRVTGVQIDVRKPGKPRIMVTVRDESGKIAYLSVTDLADRKASEIVAESLKAAQAEESEQASKVISG